MTAGAESGRVGTVALVPRRPSTGCWASPGAALVAVAHSGACPSRPPCLLTTGEAQGLGAHRPLPMSRPPLPPRPHLRLFSLCSVLSSPGVTGQEWCDPRVTSSPGLLGVCCPRSLVPVSQEEDEKLAQAWNYGALCSLRRAFCVARSCAPRTYEPQPALGVGCSAVQLGRPVGHGGRILGGWGC